MRLLVTGACGFVGSTLIPTLLLALPGLEVVEGDIRHEADLAGIGRVDLPGTMKRLAVCVEGFDSFLFVNDHPDRTEVEDFLRRPARVAIDEARAPRKALGTPRGRRG